MKYHLFMLRVFRYAPSPTGRIHLGQLKAALFPYILAKKHEGKFILRIEDTDNKRNQENAVKMLIEDLNWLGIEYDLGPDSGDTKNSYFQSQREEIYKKHIEELQKKNLVYKAYDTPEERAEQIKIQRSKGQSSVYSGNHANLTEEEIKKFEDEGRKPVLRLRVPKNEIIEFNDKIFGNIKVNTNQIGDIVIQKSDGTPMYNFCVVVDDHEMGVTDVIRGFGHLSNTAKQVLLYKIFNWEVPVFAHFSDIQNENQPGKLSKRYGAKSISQFRAEGYLPDALINYVVSISCSFHFSKKEDEIMTKEDIISAIEYEKILKTNAKFNTKKLDWFNGQHIRRLSDAEYLSQAMTWLKHEAKNLSNFDSNFDISIIDKFLSDTEKLNSGLLLIKERITKFSEIFSYLDFLFENNDSKPLDISPAKHTSEEFEIARMNLYNAIISLERPWSHSDWEAKIRTTADNIGWKHGDLFMALRLLVVKSPFSPPLFESMEILGSDECLKRIKENR